MDKKERVRNSIKGKPVDRVPVSFYTHFFDQTDNTVGAHIRWVKATGMDMIAVEPDGFYGLRSDSPLETIEDWKAFRPYKKDDPFIVKQVDRVKRISEGLADDAAVYYWFFTPFAFFKHTLGEGQTRVMEFWNEDRESVLQVLDVLEETNYLFIDEMNKAGLDGLCVSMQHGEFWRFTKEDYLRYLEPFDQRLIRYTNSLSEYNVGHFCSWATMDSDAAINLSLYKEYDFPAVNWGVFQPRSLTMKEGRSFFTKASCVMGGFDRSSRGILFGGSEKEIKDYTSNLINETGEEGFILSADCSIHVDTPDSHIRWVVEAAEEYAQHHAAVKKIRR